MGSVNQPFEPFQNQLLGEDADYFKTNFLLTDSDIFRLLEVFQEFDGKTQGYLTMDDFIHFIIEDNYTLLLPCIIHLFRLIAKQDTDKIYFQEWLGSMISFCLYNKQALFRFTFEMIDTDYDDKISYEDISYYLNFQDPKTQIKVFPISFISSFEQSKISKTKDIHFEEFRKINQNLKFLCWSAQNLQENLRKKLLGNVFWESLNERIEEEQSKLKKMSNKDRLDEEKKKMKEQKFRKLFENKQKKEMRFKKRMDQRKPGEIGSDTLLSFKNSVDGLGLNTKKEQTRQRRKSLFD